MAYLASQRPDLDGDDIMHGIMTGALLGGLLGLRGYKKVKFNKDNDKAYNNLAKKFLDENNAKTMEEGGFVPPNSSGGVIRPTNNNPNPLKGDGSGERIFDWYDEATDLAATSRVRKDKRLEIDVTPVGKKGGKKDEYILDKKKNGEIEVRKCK